jgi:hypothetical protein
MTFLSMWDGLATGFTSRTHPPDYLLSLADQGRE